MWGLRVDYSQIFRRIVCKTSIFPSCEFLGIRNIHQTTAMPKRMHSVEQDELLIAEVEKYPFLYDRNNGFFNNHNMRKEKWEEISAVVGISDLDAKLRWINIRDCFSRCLKKARKRAHAKGAQSYRYHYKYASQLEFLLPYLPLGESSSMTEDGDQQSAKNAVDGEEGEVDDFQPNQVPSATPIPHPVVKKRKQQDHDDSMMDYLITHDNAPREDGLDTFFKSICATVRKLPPIAQAQLRFQITELVFKAEMNHLTNDHETGNE